ncbi:hypothetical protein [Haloferax chudinovii]|uniref:Uncharacterized protein n=1 Tax=Haloferax chudinovii TaxID=1109010 RepID=A0ABD5XJ24_9EURY
MAKYCGVLSTSVTESPPTITRSVADAIVTTDELELSEFEELEVALRRMLESTPGV